jgi:hypothetical protein
MQRIGRRSFAAGLGAAWALRVLRAGATTDGRIATFALSFAFAEENGQRVQDATWLATELAETARLYGPLGVRFQTPSDRALGSSHTHVETRADRDAFVGECVPKAINVFVVASLRDVDDGVSLRRGVHWRCSQHRERRYIIVSAIAGPTVLAHELGHYFGNGHSTEMDNLMSYERTGGEVFLDPLQSATIKREARLALTSGELGDVGSTPARAAVTPTPTAL